MIDSSGLFVAHWPFPLPLSASMAAYERLSQVAERVSVCVCVCWGGGILEIKPSSPMLDCPAIDTHSEALKGFLRHHWINSYSYASIHHPALHLHSSLVFWQIPTLPPPDPHPLTLNFPGIWARTSENLVPAKGSYASTEREAFAFSQPFHAYKWLKESPAFESQNFRTDHWSQKFRFWYSWWITKVHLKCKKIQNSRETFVLHSLFAPLRKKKKPKNFQMFKDTHLIFGSSEEKASSSNLPLGFYP